MDLRDYQSVDFSVEFAIALDPVAHGDREADDKFVSAELARER